MPIFNFYGSFDESRDRPTSLAALARRANAEQPWAGREATVFAGFMFYERSAHAGPCSPTERPGVDGRPLGKESPRKHLAEWAANGSDPRLDVGARRLRIAEWSRYKYIAHVDGISCSSKLEQTLAMGCLAIKEESGYRSFWHRLLRPYVHYVPFWKQRPQELTAALAWAQAHDGAAGRIAAAGQQLARLFLSRRGLACYWALLLGEYAKLLRFQPGSSNSSEVPHRSLMPVGQWLAAAQAEQPQAWKGPEELDLGWSAPAGGEEEDEEEEALNIAKRAKAEAEDDSSFLLL